MRSPDLTPGMSDVAAAARSLVAEVLAGGTRLPKRRVCLIKIPASSLPADVVSELAGDELTLIVTLSSHRVPAAVPKKAKAARKIISTAV